MVALYVLQKEKNLTWGYDVDVEVLDEAELANILAGANQKKEREDLGANPKPVLPGTGHLLMGDSQVPRLANHMLRVLRAAMPLCIGGIDTPGLLEAARGKKKFSPKGHSYVWNK
ncbi:hypothetical protein M8J76_008224 [Diaphorina citri]|nr:hypothetical protein M8J75_013418 [Diaphorina citri]KAI5736894.1 hypothetical protein M8J76_008224 [Diaphorina citri]